MTTTTNETIRQAVRENYAKIAECNTRASGKIAAGSCCSGPEVDLKKLSAAMGYSQEDLAAVPAGANLGLGCGNPVALGSIKPGETVIDLGSGGGFDCFLAAQKTGASGSVIGIDMTPAMVSKNASCSCLVIGPRAPCPITILSMLRTGVISTAEPVKNTSSAM